MASRAARLALSVVFVLSFMGLRNARADVPIAIDVGSYTGVWKTDGGAWVTGNQSVPLAGGTHTFNNNSDTFQFTVDAAGNVTSLNGAAATGGAGRLQLQTTSLTIDRGNVQIAYNVAGYSRYSDQVRSFGAIVGLKFQISTAAGSPIATAIIAADGSISLTAGAASVTVVPGGVVFNAVPVSVDPGSYAGAYDAEGGGRISGRNTYNVIPGVDMHINQPWNGLLASFIEQADGSITLLDGRGASASSGLISFANTTITIDPQQYQAQYDAYGSPNQRISGKNSYTIIPDAEFVIVQPPGGTIARFTASASGVVTLLQGTKSVVAGAGSISFLNTTVSIDPQRYAGQYDAYASPGGRNTGPVGPFIVIPNVPFPISFGWGGLVSSYSVDVDGTVTILQGQDSSLAGPAKVLLKNVVLSVAPNGDLPNGYGVYGIDSGVHGGDTQVVIPGENWFINVWPNGVSPGFFVSPSCAVTPSQVVAAGITFSLSCATSVSPPPPAASCVGTASQPVTIETAAGTCGAAIGAENAGSCANGTCTFDDNTSEILGPGAHEVSVVATSSTGATASCTSYVKVVDAQPPQIVCPPPTTVECAGALTAAEPGASCSDNCGCTASCAGGSYPYGTSSTTCSAADQAGNTSTCTAEITVVDTTPPAIFCPAPATVECTNGQGTISAFAATGWDRCSGNVAPDDHSGSYALGSHTVSFQVTDAHGLSNSCQSSVEVVDTQAPAISVSVSPSTLWPPDHKLVRITISTSASDACDAQPTVSCSAVSSEADGAQDIVWQNGQLSLRATRDGNGPGRTYTITCTAADSSGNRAQASATVVVPHDQGR